MANDGLVPKDAEFVDMPRLGGSPGAAVQTAQEAIKRDLGAQVPGYEKTARGLAKFNFRVQPASHTSYLTQKGNPYPAGSLGQAGIPETERTLPVQDAYVNDIPVPGRKMPDVHRPV
jgi:hypothetical protein